MNFPSSAMQSTITTAATPCSPCMDIRNLEPQILGRLIMDTGYWAVGKQAVCAAMVSQGFRQLCHADPSVLATSFINTCLMKVKPMRTNKGKKKISPALAIGKARKKALYHAIDRSAPLPIVFALIDICCNLSPESLDECDSSSGLTPLFRSITKCHGPNAKREMSIVRSLLEAGTDLDVMTTVNKNNKNCQAPILKAIQLGNMELVTALLEGGAELDTQDSFEDYPIHYSARGGHAQITKLLIDRGADPTVVNLSGQKPIAVARAAIGAGSAVEAVLVAAGGDLDDIADEEEDDENEDEDEDEDNEDAGEGDQEDGGEEDD